MARLKSLPYGLRVLLATLSWGLGPGLVGIALPLSTRRVARLAETSSTDLLQQFKLSLRRFSGLECDAGSAAATTSGMSPGVIRSVLFANKSTA